MSKWRGTYLATVTSIILAPTEATVALRSGVSGAVAVSRGAVALRAEGERGRRECKGGGEQEGCGVHFAKEKSESTAFEIRERKRERKSNDPQVR